MTKYQLNCSTYTSHDMEDTRTAHRNADSWLACQVAIGSSCVGGSLLIAKTDEANAEIQAFLSNVGDRKTWYSKDDLDSKVVQCSSDDLGSSTHVCDQIVVSRREEPTSCVFEALISQANCFATTHAHDSSGRSVCRSCHGVNRRGTASHELMAQNDSCGVRSRGVHVWWLSAWAVAIHAMLFPMEISERRRRRMRRRHV
jgi:hypothetical protein